MADGETSKSVEIPAALVTNVGTASTGIVTSLLTAIAGNTLDSLRPQIRSYLAKNEGVAYLMKYIDINEVYIPIEDELERDYNNILTALKAGIGQGVGGIHGSLYEQLTGTNALLQAYNGMLQRVGFEPRLSRYYNKMFTPNIPNAEIAWYMNRIGALTDTQYGEYLNQNGWEDALKTPLGAAWTRQPAIEILIELTRRNLMTADTLKYLLKWYRFTDEVIEGVAALTVGYPEPYRLADMFVKGNIESKEYFEAMRINGLDARWAGAWARMQMTFPTPDVCLTLLRRGLITDVEFAEYSRRNNYGFEQISQMMQLRDVIPPISDLIRFAIREAYGDHDPEKQYAAMVEIAKKMGLTPETAEWYWYSHWDRIPVNLMYSNYFRGRWDKAKLERMLKIVDIHPDDREDIISVAYGPPSIREMGYGYDVGVYTEEDIEKYRSWGGLSPEDAKKATEAMVAYRTEAERNAVRTEYVYAFGRGKLTEDELLERITAIGTPPAAIPLWIERAEFYRERIMKPQMDTEGRVVSSSEALRVFKAGLRNEDWTRSALKALDWTDERINVAIEMAKIDIREATAKEEEVKYRKLTLAQLRQMFNQKLITKEQMVTEIIIIGYSPDDADFLAEIYTQPTAAIEGVKPFTSAVAANMYRLAMFDEKDLYDNFLMQDWTEQQAAMLTIYTVLIQKYPVLRDLYAKGVISTVNFIDELKKLDLPEYEAILLVKNTYEELQYERLTREKDLTKAEIIKGVKNNILTPSQGAGLLQDIGYDENEAWYILAINKVVEAGDPEGYWDMRKVTEAYKKARGEKVIDIPDELIMLEREQRKIKAEIDELKKKGIDESRMGELSVELAGIEGQMKKIMLEKGLK